MNDLLFFLSLPFKLLWLGIRYVVARINEDVAWYKLKKAIKDSGII